MKTFSIKGISKLLCGNEYSQCDYIVSYGVSEEGKEHIKVVFDKIIQKTRCACLQYHEKHLLYADHKTHTCAAADSSMNGTRLSKKSFVRFHMARDEDLSRLRIRRSRSASSRPRVRLVTSLERHECCGFSYTFHAMVCLSQIRMGPKLLEKR